MIAFPSRGVPGPLGKVRRVVAHAISAGRHEGAAEQADLLSSAKHGILAGLAIVILLLPPDGVRLNEHTGPLQFGSKQAQPRSEPVNSAPRAAEAQFGALTPSHDAKKMADWVAFSSDNNGAPFVVLDKRGARVYVFDGKARLLGSSLVLLGSAIGDDSAANIGTRKLSEIRPDERTTAAGRFVSEPGRDETGEKVVWVDYESALAMHRVKVVDPKERRFERIATDSVHDKRISNGCINVPIPFFDAVIEPVLGHSHAVFYILPEVKPLNAVFPRAYAPASG